MSSRLVEKDDALWVQVERVDSAEQGWVEYAGTEGVNLQLDDNCGSARSSTPIDTPMSNLGPFLILEDGSQYTCKLAPPQNNAGSDSEAYSQQIVPTIMLTPELAIMATVDIQRLATSTVTVTPIPQPTTIIMLTPTPLPVSRNFCLAEVQESSGASKLDVVRVDPSSNAASTGISIKVGIKVRAVDVTKDKLWYLIQTESGSPIGWIPSTYLYFLECQN
jgi:hypothetical protein